MAKNGGEAVVVCSDKSMGIGITIWGIDTGDRLLHIPTCASAPHGLVCLRNQFLVASQIHKHGSVGGGAISMWPLNKPQQPIRSYPLEAIGPLSCTKDGVYLAGGALSGNVYLWEVANGKLLKTWRGHHRSLNCMLFSDDGSLLVSASDDGMICVWSMVGLLDMEDSQSFPSLLHYSMEHKSSITGLLTTSGSSNVVLISSSLDGSCKVWDLVLGKLMQTQVYPLAITAVVLHPAEQLFFSGSIDGRIFVNKLEIGLVENSLAAAEDKKSVIKGHKGAVTALTFSQAGLVSAFEDCTICIWDITNWAIIRRFDHKKGAVTNLAVIPQSSLLSVSNHRRVSNAFGVSSLDKYPQPPNSSKEKMPLLSSCHFLKGNQTTHSEQQICDTEEEFSPAAMQMKLETSLEHRMWATRMAKHVMEMNTHLQTRLLDLMQSGLLRSTSTEMDSPPTKKRETRMFDESPPFQGEEQP
ncbi:PREDICTED: WD [Prunus dulcis]|uniref:PREDICTED: WD n=1 Tax=Prunus dulcis TaxID=3755 RepID=A0A5E4F1W2_PRUDU|nr:protein ROOT INITIATION DEFECTIVE 3-like [Prunus dulcis]VVA21756.1 PREDICTED: WD [Prunus dulcis]